MKDRMNDKRYEETQGSKVIIAGHIMSCVFESVSTVGILPVECVNWGNFPRVGMTTGLSCGPGTPTH